ncbi:MAG: hypothetical protein GY786_15405, partial [Proteobacteria bacterium]|nr:hypothetical protein [Pseudomonadota bacterium]
FNSVSNRRLKGSKYLLELNWSAVQYLPPVLSTGEFFEYINAQKDSRFFKRKEEIKLIQINAEFEEDISFAVPKKTALNLTKLYQVPKEDFKDRIYLHYDSATIFYSEGIEYLRTHWKAYMVKINHQRLKIPAMRIK